MINVSSMDPRRSGQDVLRCDLCEDPGPNMYCDVCHINLCKACVGEHLSDESIEHRVVPFRKRGFTLTCPKHSPKICELHCKQCNDPICSLCVSSGEHEQHKKIDILKYFEHKKAEIKEDLQELEYNIYPTYQKFASRITVQKDNVKENSKKLKLDISKHGEILHRKIDDIIEKEKKRVDRIDSKILVALNEQEDEYTNCISEIKQSIVCLKILLDSNDICPVSTYRPNIDRFRKLPAKPMMPKTIFFSKEVNENKLAEQFGHVMGPIIRKEEQGYISKSLNLLSSPPNRTLTDVPRTILNTDIRLEPFSKFCSISCLNDEEFWTCGYDNMMRLYNFYGDIVKSIQTKTGGMPRDIAVTKNGDLVYTDPLNFTVNIVKNTQIYDVVTLQEWTPHFVCSSSSGDFLVVMFHFDKGEVKVVRYSGSTEKQTIQFDSEGRPLFVIPNYHCKIDCTTYIAENRNLDICVADAHKQAIIVVNHAGELRFQYTGIPQPAGIATDSQGRILAVESNKHRIHILDQDGQFLRYIDKCDLVIPWSLCVDNDDKLVVLMKDSGNVKKIQYCL